MPSIGSIFPELKRIIKKGGLIFASIDCSDHYPHTDSGISALNYFSYSDAEWEKYHHRSHYQNRLRHHDYEETFNNLGFVTERNEPFFEDHPLPSRVAARFNTENNLFLAISGYFVLRVVLKSAAWNKAPDGELIRLSVATVTTIYIAAFPISAIGAVAASVF